MSYSAYENEVNAALERVEAICRHLTSDGSFTDDSPIMLSDVENFLTDSYYWLMGELASEGYSPAQTDTEVRGILMQVQALDAAAQVEFSMPVTDTGEPNERWRALVERRDHMVETLLQGAALERLGATRDQDKSNDLLATGVSRDRKKTVYDDSDLVVHRFKRGWGQEPRVPLPRSSDRASWDSSS